MLHLPLSQPLMPPILIKQLQPIWLLNTLSNQHHNHLNHLNHHKLKHHKLKHQPQPQPIHLRSFHHNPWLLFTRLFQLPIQPLLSLPLPLPLFTITLILDHIHILMVQPQLHLHQRFHLPHRPHRLVLLSLPHPLPTMRQPPRPLLIMSNPPSSPCWLSPSNANFNTGWMSRLHSRVPVGRHCWYCWYCTWWECIICKDFTSSPMHWAFICSICWLGFCLHWKIWKRSDPYCLLHRMEMRTSPLNDVCQSLNSGWWIHEFKFEFEFEFEFELQCNQSVAIGLLQISLRCWFEVKWNQQTCSVFWNSFVSTCTMNVQLRLSFAKAVLLAMTATFFQAFDVPVFWPILLIYFIVLFVLSMKARVEHMIKHRYFPCDFRKKKYRSGASSGVAALPKKWVARWMLNVECWMLNVEWYLCLPCLCSIAAFTSCQDLIF